ncbi:glycosyltransferase family 4 protein [Cupriavidus pinatubonensis]|uniref:glycosyltransferase family 4 protein n=1 Tax=Cupriavidus pinatubonensis TaxID=248026 RepID=UPI001C72A370|nr:glycosyltransferase family 4 protein [Cupriavidus pinatubonensis]QYY32325.1 glycosyltransferase family 4 protein [Cupriavidus pinatubonensis]
MSATAARRPRIAYLITNSEIGGAQAHVADLMQAMRQHADVTLLAGGDGHLFATAQAAGIPAIRLRTLDNALSPVRAVRTLRELNTALRQVAPDIIHAHSAKAGALGRVAGRMLGIPVIYTVHGFAFKPAAPWRQRLAARVGEWLLAPLTTRLICVADGERELARSLPIAASRISVIRNGLDDVTARATPRDPLRRIAMVARFARPKRPDVLLDAFAQAGLTDCELVMAGDGPQLAAIRARAQALAPARVGLPGSVHDVPGLLASAQVFVLVSDHEAFPLSVLEAMRAGLPVIASDLPGIREQLDDGRCGILLEDNRPQTLARALQALAADAPRREALGRLARQRWEQQFGLTRMIQATWAVYQDTLASAPRYQASARQRHAEN